MVTDRELKCKYCTILNGILFTLELMMINLPRKGSRSGTTPKLSTGLQQMNSLPSEEYKLLCTQLQLSYRNKYLQSKLTLFITDTRTSTLLAALLGCIQKFPH
jgi:hypothetical protein